MKPASSRNFILRLTLCTSMAASARKQSDGFGAMTTTTASFDDMALASLLLLHSVQLSEPLGNEQLLCALERNAAPLISPRELAPRSPSSVDLTTGARCTVVIDLAMGACPAVTANLAVEHHHRGWLLDCLLVH
jgi:hypothetical protein